MAKKAVRQKTRGERNADWIERHLFIPEGQFVGQSFKLAKFQREIILRIYDNPAVTRRAIISLPRKNAKTTLCACLLILHLVGPESLPNAQLYSAARSREQASIVFKLAHKMILQSPTLRPLIRANNTKKMLSVPTRGTVYQALSKDASTAQGLSPVFVIHDELGQVKGPRDDLYEAMETASGAQREPLTMVISTQAPTDADLLSLLIDDALTDADPKQIAIVHSCPKDVDAFSPAALKLAHPAWSEFINQDEVRGLQNDASRMPSKENSFRNLMLNQRVDVTTPFINQTVWDQNGGDPEPWQGKDVYLGLDLSSTTDLTALCIVHRNADGWSWSVHPFFWLPKEGLSDKARQDKVPYDIWSSKGMITTPDGAIVNYDCVATFLMDIANNANIQKVAFDRFNIKHFKKAMERVGFMPHWVDNTFHPFGQSFVSMSPAIRELETAILNNQLKHGKHPILTWNMNNIKVVEDHTKNRRFEKQASTRRIDGAIALVMALGTAVEFDTPNQIMAASSTPRRVISL